MDLLRRTLGGTTRGIAILMLIASTRAVAQATPVATTAWVEAGVGRATAGWTVPLSGTVEHRRTRLTARFSESSQDLLEGGRTLRELGLLVGRTFLASGHVRMSAAAGLARVSCEDIEGCGTADGGGNPQTTRSGLGVPLVAQVSLPFTRFLGAGLQGYANLNRVESLGGAAVVIQVGRLR